MAAVRIKCLKVYLIIKITCFFCSRRKCTKMRTSVYSVQRLGKSKGGRMSQGTGWSHISCSKQHCSRLPRQPITRHWTQVSTTDPCYNRGHHLTPQHHDDNTRKLCASRLTYLHGQQWKRYNGRYVQVMSAAIQQPGWQTKQGMQLCLLDCWTTHERPRESGSHNCASSRNRVDHHRCTPLETFCWKCHHMGTLLTHLCKASGKNVNRVLNFTRIPSYKWAKPSCHIFQMLKLLPNCA